MHAFQISMGTHCFGLRRRIISLDAVVAAVSNLTRELIIGFNEDGHSGRKFSVGGSEGGIGLTKSSNTKGVKIFVEVIS